MNAMLETQLTILIVEDEQAIRRFVRAALESEGHRVHEADTLQRGLLEAGTRKPDVVILDLGLPDGDGVVFIRDLRAWSVIPILVLSARSEEYDKVAALDAVSYTHLDVYKRQVFCWSTMQSPKPNSFPTFWKLWPTSGWPGGTAPRYCSGFGGSPAAKPETA